MSCLFSASIQAQASQFNKGKWSLSEDEILRNYVEQFGEKKWKKISELIVTRSPLQCLHRWTKILKPGMIKGPWTMEEDQQLTQWVRVYGANKWSMAAKVIPGRNGKQCRERWINHLNPEIKKGNWTEAEDEKIYQLYKKFGSAWSKIARHFVGRSENSIKNRFYATLRKFDHVRRHSEFLNLAKIENVENISNSNCSTTDPSPEKFQVKAEAKEIPQSSEALFNDQIFNFNFENNWNFEEDLEDDGSCFKQDTMDICNSPCPEEIKKDISSPMNQNNVMEILNEIMEDDKRLDSKILNMIESLKNIELQLMDKIAISFKQENGKQDDLKRTFQELKEEEEEFEEFECLKKVRML